VPRSNTTAFPLGLYGALLLALCWLLLPALFAPAERLLLGVACLPQRWLAALGGGVAVAAGDEAAAQCAARCAAQCASLRARLRARCWEHDVEPGRALAPAALEPLLCRVLTATGTGGGGLPSELQLDRSYRELAGCADFVTKGDQLLGFLARPGVGVAQRDRPDDPARVLLLDHKESRAVPATVLLPDGGELRCVVEAAAAVDPAPLRTALHDDPYRAARLQRDGIAVRTLALEQNWVGTVPQGFGLGKTKVWGYRRADGETLTIGVYVEPAHDPRALSSVVVWQSVPEAQAIERGPEMVAARLQPLAGERGGRWLLDGTAAVPDGAAVVQDGLCLGRARGVAFGQGLVTSLAASRQPWALLLLPDDESLAPLELFGEVVAADGAVAWFRPRRGAVPAAAGVLFTGANGALCPAGLLLGRAEAAGALLRIATPLPSGPQIASVAVAGH
jgi:hypothetical protein